MTLHQLCELSGASMRQIAIQAGISYRLLRKYASGEADPENMTVGTAKKIRAVIGCQLDELAGFDLTEEGEKALKGLPLQDIVKRIKK